MGKKKNVIMDGNQDQDLDLMSMEDLELEPNQTKETKKDIKSISSKNKKSSKNRSIKYKGLKKTLDKGKYKSADAIKAILSVSKEKFDASIELHLQIKKDRLSGTIDLPHSTGISKKVVIFNDEIEKTIKDQKIDFDILIAKPQDMPKLAKYARFLGPKGLMPNPKNGTVAADPDKAIKNFSGNKVSYKTEKKFPLIHLTIGKRSLGEEKLLENLEAIIKSVNSKQIKKASISSSMSPSISLEL